MEPNLPRRPEAKSLTRMAGSGSEEASRPQPHDSKFLIFPPISDIIIQKKLKITNFN